MRAQTAASKASRGTPTGVLDEGLSEGLAGAEKRVVAQALVEGGESRRLCNCPRMSAATYRQYPRRSPRGSYPQGGPVFDSQQDAGSTLTASNKGVGAQGQDSSVRLLRAFLAHQAIPTHLAQWTSGADPLPSLFPRPYEVLVPQKPPIRSAWMTTAPHARSKPGKPLAARRGASLGTYSVGTRQLRVNVADTRACGATVIMPRVIPVCSEYGKTSMSLAREILPAPCRHFPTCRSTISGSAAKKRSSSYHRSGCIA